MTSWLDTVERHSEPDFVPEPCRLRGDSCQQTMSAARRQGEDNEHQRPTCGGSGVVPDDDDDEDVIRTSASSFCRGDRRRTVTKLEWRNVGYRTDCRSLAST